MLTVIQFRTDKSGPHELQCIFNKAQKNGLKWFDIYPVNIFSPLWNISEILDILSQSKAVILGGSGEHGFYQLGTQSKRKNEMELILDRIKPILEFVVKKDIPTLAICFGHQLLGWYLGARVLSGKPEFKEVGFFKISLTTQGKGDPLFAGMPNSFYVSEGHKSAVVFDRIPNSVKVLATGERTYLQAFKLRNNVYSLQFHPELTYKENIERFNMFADEYASVPDELKERLLDFQYKGQIKANMVFYNFLKLYFAR